MLTETELNEIKETLQRPFRDAQRRREARMRKDVEEDRHLDATLAAALRAGTRTEEECARHRRENEAARRLRDEREEEQTLRDTQAFAAAARALVEVHRELKDLRPPAALRR